MQEYSLRPYQKECKQSIEKAGPGRHLAVLATGLGKTVVFTHLDGMGRTLILSHRDELVRQPEKYYAGRASFGVEKAEDHATDEEIVSASVQSLSRDSRLKSYAPDAFETVIIDEAHHAAAPSYKKIIDHFSGAKRLIGFTATPRRGDGVRLTDVFDDIIFNRDLRWGIENGYLSRIRCIEVGANYDLKKVSKTAGDFSIAQLEEVLENGDCIPVAAKAYIENCHNKGRHTLIYCVTKKFSRVLLNTIRNLLPDEEKDTVQMVDGETPDEIRKDVLTRFSEGSVRCIVNCMVLTEGTDLPICDTIINLRPTCNDSLYQQMAGRGTRLYDSKDYCLLIDIVPEDGNSASRGLCTAPSLFGLDPSLLGEKEKSEFAPDKDLLTVCDTLGAAMASQTKNISLRIRSIDLFMEEREALLRRCEGKPAVEFAKEYRQFRDNRIGISGTYDFGSLDVETQAEEIRYYKITPNWNDVIYIAKPDVLDNTVITFNVSPHMPGYQQPVAVSGSMKMQDAIELAKMYCELGQDWQRYSWCKEDQKIWEKMPATDRQVGKLETECRKYGIYMDGTDGLDKLGASRLIDLIMQLKEAKKNAEMWKLSESTKNTKKVKSAKEWAEQVIKNEAKMQGGQEKFEAFKEAVYKTYEKIKRKRTEMQNRAAREAKPGMIVVVPDYLPSKNQPASQSQLAFAESLKLKAERLECFFPGLELKSLTKRQASVLITFLLQVCDKAKPGCGWKFHDVADICAKSEEDSDPVTTRFEFPYQCAILYV